MAQHPLAHDHGINGCAIQGFHGRAQAALGLGADPGRKQKRIDLGNRSPNVASGIEQAKIGMRTGPKDPIASLGLRTRFALFGIPGLLDLPDRQSPEAQPFRPGFAPIDQRHVDARIDHG